MRCRYILALAVAAVLSAGPAWAQSSIGMPLNPLGGRAGGEIPRNTANTNWFARNITPPITLKDGANIVPNAYSTCFFLLTLTGNSHALQFPVGLPPQGGEWCTFEIKQDSGGPYSFTLDQRYLFGAGTFQLTQAANSRDLISCANPPGFLDCGTIGALAPIALSTYDPSRTGSNISLSNANRTALINSGTDTIVPTTLFHSAGKWNAQFTVTHVAGGQNTAIGFASSSATLTNYLGNGSDTIGVFDDGAVFVGNANKGNVGITMANGDVVNLILDEGGKTIQAAKNGGALGASIDVSAATTFNLSPAASLHASPDQVTWTPTATNVYPGAATWN